MLLLAFGLLLFLGMHLLPVAQPARAALHARLGAARYKGLFSLASLAGLALVVAGWWVAGPGPRLFAPSPVAVRVAPEVMTVVFILLSASHSPSHLRAAVQHPMLVAILLWSTLHLCANGDARGTLLFGAFLAFAVVDLVSVVRRHAVARFVPRWRADATSVVAGVVVALVVMYFHRVLFGPRVVAWGF